MAPLSMEFSRQEYCSGLSFTSPGDLPDPGVEPSSPALQAYIHTHIYNCEVFYLYMYNGIVFSLLKKKKKEILSFATRWMTLEGIKLSEMSQTKKGKYWTVQDH